MCFKCGRVDHITEYCRFVNTTERSNVDSMRQPHSVTAGTGDCNERRQCPRMEVELNAETHTTEGTGDFGPWMVVKRKFKKTQNKL